jgi:hypothetical protein
MVQPVPQSDGLQRGLGPDAPIRGGQMARVQKRQLGVLERGNGGSGTPSVTPVSGRPSDDVYIIF